MIQYIRGKITEKSEDAVTVEANDIGYEVMVPPGGRLHNIPEGDEATVYVEMAVREDEVKLYGFYSSRDKKIFRKLVSVNGVGAKVAMSIFASMSPEDIIKSIVFEDPEMLCRAKGLGKKTAQKIILELKDKIDKIDTGGSVIIESDLKGAPAPDGEKAQALVALTELGYTRAEASQMLSFDDEGGMTVEEYIKRALQNL